MSKSNDVILDFASEMTGIPSETISALNYAVQNGYRTIQNYGRTRTQAPSKRRRIKKSYKSSSSGIYTGKMVPPLSFGKNVKMSKPKLVTLKEVTGKVTDDEVVWVGLGVNYEFLIENVCKLLAHCIMSKANFDMTNYDNDLGFQGEITYRYYSTPLQTAISSRTVTIAVIDSLNDIAQSLFVDFKNFSSVSGPHKFKTFILTSTVNTQPQIISQFNASSLNISLGVYQTLLLQNETLSGTNDTSTENVASNPLQISIFDSNSNIVYQKQRDNSDILTWKPWLHFNGFYPEVFAYTADGQFGAIQKPNQLSKIFSNAKQTYRAILQPGEMKKVQLTHKFEGNFNKWLKTFYYVFANDGSTDTQVVSVPGKSRIMAFDKMISTGAAKTTVGYELNQQISGSYRYKQPKGIVPQYD